MFAKEKEEYKGRATESNKNLPQREYTPMSRAQGPSHVQFREPINTWGSDFLKESVSPHTTSFNMMLRDILPSLIKTIRPSISDFGNDILADIKFTDFRYDPPIKTDRSLCSSDPRLYPSHCRQSFSTYSSPFFATLSLTIKRKEQFIPYDALKFNAKDVFILKNQYLGNIPVMVGSSICSINSLSPEKMVKVGEDPDERGGYFIINGIEKVIRMLIQAKTNHPLLIMRSSFSSKGALYSHYGVQMRSTRIDTSTNTNMLHYRKDGTVWVSLRHRRIEYLVPFILIAKALANDMSDKSLLRLLCGSGCIDTYAAERVICMFDQHYSSVDTKKVITTDDSISFIGSKFFVGVFPRELYPTIKEASSSELNEGIDSRQNSFFNSMPNSFRRKKRGRGVSEMTNSPVTSNNVEGVEVTRDILLYVGNCVLDELILVHCRSRTSKLRTLVLMFSQLIGLVREKLKPDNLDAMDSQEILTAGQIYSYVFKDILQGILDRFASIISKKAKECLIQEVVNSKSRKSVSRKKEGENNNNKDSIEYRTNNNSTLQTLLTRKDLEVALSSSSDLTKRLEHFLATGNISFSRRGSFELSQQSGFTVLAEKINTYRYLSHFRAVHRGSYFTEMKTTAVRKLRPETWGFLCPVHTPDGTPCGLLNHLSLYAGPVLSSLKCGDTEIFNRVISVLTDIGIEIIDHMSIINDVPMDSMNRKSSPVTVDGIVVGFVPTADIEQIGNRLRMRRETRNMKASENRELSWTRGENKIGMSTEIEERSKEQEKEKEKEKELLLPMQTEIAAVDECPGVYSGIWIFANPGRLSRPIKRISDGRVEYVGPMEQVYLPIAVSSDDLLDNDSCDTLSRKSILTRENMPVSFSHIELSPIAILSIIAGLTPFSNHNQSPRNMYQCQMLKQAMCIPFLNHEFRTDNKVYTITYPQFPIVRTSIHSLCNFDCKPSGTNAVVAVISYSGYDMDDALVINKMSYERGFKHGSIYKTLRMEECDVRTRVGSTGLRLVTNSEEENGKYKNVYKNLSVDGFPNVGTHIKEGSALYSYREVRSNKINVAKYKDHEDSWLQQVTAIGGGMWTFKNQVFRDSHKAYSMKLRMKRNPVTGDKFASRHGQKGVVGMLWPQEDLPFNGRTGMVPDILFNPHGFPSRMTVGMLIEVIAGKAGALNGVPVIDSTAFREYPLKSSSSDGDDPEEVPTYEYFGRVLEKYGYSYTGTEEMYSGIHGTKMEIQIFTGLVYYQRLRHMVQDKFQVRAEGPIDPLTRQPVKGRKRHGGIRFGEMERDSLISHGCSALIKDRLLICSDACKDWICPSCGSLMTHSFEREEDTLMSALRTREELEGELHENNMYSNRALHKERNIKYPICIRCSTPSSKVECRRISIPYVLKYLSAELMSMNINMKLNLE